MKKQVISSFAVVAGAVACGFFFTMQSWDGVIFISNSQLLDSHRNPAAIRKVFDFSELDGGALQLRSKKRLIEDAKLVSDHGKVGIELGHFVTRGEGNQKVFACDFYEHVNLTFRAEGVASSGEIPHMTIEAPCKVSEDLNLIAAIYIPVERILGERPADMDLRYDQSAVSFHFENMTSGWPKAWVLEKVRLSREENPGADIYISEDELHEIARPLVLKW